MEQSRGNLTWDSYVGILRGTLKWDSYVGLLRGTLSLGRPMALRVPRKPWSGFFHSAQIPLRFKALNSNLLQNLISILSVKLLNELSQKTVKHNSFWLTLNL